MDVYYVTWVCCSLFVGEAKRGGTQHAGWNSYSPAPTKKHKNVSSSGVVNPEFGAQNEICKLFAAAAKDRRARRVESL